MADGWGVGAGALSPCRAAVNSIDTYTTVTTHPEEVGVVAAASLQALRPRRAELQHHYIGLDEADHVAYLDGGLPADMSRSYHENLGFKRLAAARSAGGGVGVGVVWGWGWGSVGVAHVHAFEEAVLERIGGQPKRGLTSAPLLRLRKKVVVLLSTALVLLLPLWRRRPSTGGGGADMLLLPLASATVRGHCRCRCRCHAMPPLCRCRCCKGRACGNSRCHVWWSVHKAHTCRRCMPAAGSAGGGRLTEHWSSAIVDPFIVAILCAVTQRERACIVDGRRWLHTLHSADAIVQRPTTTDVPIYVNLCDSERRTTFGSSLVTAELEQEGPRGQPSAAHRLGHRALSIA